MTSLKGHLLVATPQLGAPIFARSVILMLEHSDGGAVGVILNRPTEATVATVAEPVFEEPSDWTKPIALGGPVPGPLLFLHAEDDLADSEVLPGLFSTTDATHVKELVRRRAEPSFAVANYAGWAPGQLEAEIERGSWVSLPAKAAHVFWDAVGDLWTTVIKEYNGRALSTLLGIRDVPEDPRVN